MVKVNVIRSIATQIINKETLSRLILVVQNRVTNQAMKAVDLFSFKVEIFQVSFIVLSKFCILLFFKVSTTWSLEYWHYECHFFFSYLTGGRQLYIDEY